MLTDEAPYVSDPCLPKNDYLELRPDRPSWKVEIDQDWLATTLRYISAREDLDGLEVFEDPDHPQRKAVETVPEGNVLVMDCRGDASAASAGGILITQLKVQSGVSTHPMWRPESATRLGSG